MRIISHLIAGSGFKPFSHTKVESVVAFMYFSCRKLFLWALNLFLKLLEHPMYVADLLGVFIVALYTPDTWHLPCTGQLLFTLQLHCCYGCATLFCMITESLAIV